MPAGLFFETVLAFSGFPTIHTLSKHVSIFRLWSVNLCSILGRFPAGTNAPKLLKIFPRPRQILITDFDLVNSHALDWIRTNTGSSVRITGKAIVDTIQAQAQPCSAFT
jgi:hypothetical protein